MFGIKPEYTASLWWGARAIYRLEQNHIQRTRRVKGRTQRYTQSAWVADIDCVWDRQQMEGGTDDERKAMSKWWKEKGYKRLQQECVDRFITTDCDELITFDLDGYRVMASPRASYGYLYIGVAPVPNEVRTTAT